MSTAVIIVAAGRGSRMGGDLPKQWQVLAGKPVLAHTVAAFAGMQVLVVIHPDDRALAEALGVPLVMGGGNARCVRPGWLARAGGVGRDTRPDP